MCRIPLIQQPFFSLTHTPTHQHTHPPPPHKNTPIGRSMNAADMAKIMEHLRRDPVVRAVYDAKSEEIGIGVYRFKAEIGMWVLERWVGVGGVMGNDCGWCDEYVCVIVLLCVRCGVLCKQYIALPPPTHMYASTHLYIHMYTLLHPHPHPIPTHPPTPTQYTQIS